MCVMAHAKPAINYFELELIESNRKDNLVVAVELHIHAYFDTPWTGTLPVRVPLSAHIFVNQNVLSMGILPDR